jgi:hypothetical protein
VLAILRARSFPTAMVDGKKFLDTGMPTEYMPNS